MRTVATLTGASRVLGRSLQLVLVTLVEVVVGLFTGRLGEALASLRALLGLMPRTLPIVARRQAIRGQRAVPEREVLGLQVRGSSRLTSYLRGKETATYVGADTTVRRWREASFGPPLTWFCVILAIVIGSRALIRHGVPAVGEFLPFPDSPRQLLHDYRSSFDPRGFGATVALPTGYAILSVASALTLFRMPLMMTVTVIGLYLVGGLGAWRVATVFPVSRARIAALVVYVGTPLVPGVLGAGDFSGLVWFAALPWLVHLIKRGAGLDTADPSTAVIDLVDGVAQVDLRHRFRAIAFATLVLASTAAFVPVAIALFAVCGLLIAFATLLVGGAWRVAAWLAACTAIASLLAFVLNLPWALDWTWTTVTGPQTAGASGRNAYDVASLAPDNLRFGVLALALYVPVVAAVAITRAWRLTWSARGAALVIGFGALMLLADRGALPIDMPRPSLLAVPIALGLAINAAALVGGFGTDVLGRGFGWRQPAALLANLAIVVGLVPAAVSIGDGSWNTPQPPLTTFLDSQLPLDATQGDFRVLYVGDPRVLPVPGREYTPGVAYAVVDGGALDFTDRFPTAETAGDAAVERTLQLVAQGSTLRAGRLLAPLGIRYIVLPETDGVASTNDAPIPVPAGLIAAFRNQLDIGSLPGPPALTVFANDAWIPVAAQLTGATADASKLAGDDALVRADLALAKPLMVGADGRPASSAEVTPGVVHLAIPYDSRLHLQVDGTELTSRPGFGTATDFDVTEPGTAVLSYARDSTRSLWVAVQVVLWLAVLVVAAGARASFGRRRVDDVHDETLIDLTDAPPLSLGVAGEVLGLPVWNDDDELVFEPESQPDDEATPPGDEPSEPADRPEPKLRPASRPAPIPVGRDQRGSARTPTAFGAAQAIDDAGDDAELDLAGLVASVDDDEEHT
jgi:hypothetical protein